MPRYINPQKIDFRLPYFEDENGDALVSLRAVKRCIAMTPTEDVVPREELDAMRGAANSYKMHYENLAREIFEEIERLLKVGVVEHSDHLDAYVKKGYAELKKKYITEGE